MQTNQGPELTSIAIPIIIAPIQSAESFYVCHIIFNVSYIAKDNYFLSLAGFLLLLIIHGNKENHVKLLISHLLNIVKIDL